MYLSRYCEERIRHLFRSRQVKGTVTLSIGNEAVSVGMGIPFRPGKDILAPMHRDFATHIIQEMPLYDLFCQYMANKDSPSHAREGNVHHGNAHMRKFPMISHLGNMFALVAGGTWAARKQGEQVFGLGVIGDGGSSTGDIHESMNLASVQHIPMLCIIENNEYAYSTPTCNQYNCANLSDRAKGYGIPGVTIDGTDVWVVYNAICDALETMERDKTPYLIEMKTLRLEGHAVYDTAEYVSAEEKARWLKREPLERIKSMYCELTQVGDEELRSLQMGIESYVDSVIDKAMAVARPEYSKAEKVVLAVSSSKPTLKPFTTQNVRNLNTVTAALEYILENNPKAFIVGQDIGRYGSAFKSCKGLYEKFGLERVVDMPICESATTGFCLGASQTGMLPIMEFQFADFSTEAVTQLGLNCGTWFYRTGKSAPILFRMPSGGGITLGAFHSAEFDGLWSRFPGLKLFYPYSPQETFEALIAAFYDPNPCIVFEHKLLYTGKPDSIHFDGNLDTIERPRQYTEGTDCTVVAFGAMNSLCLNIVNERKYSIDLWNPFILSPLHLEPIFQSVKKTGKLVVVQESSETAGLGDRIISQVVQHCWDSLVCSPILVSSPDAPVPFAKELEVCHIPDQNKICQAIETMIGVKR